MTDSPRPSLGRRLTRHWVAVVGLVVLVGGVWVWLGSGQGTDAQTPGATATPAPEGAAAAAERPAAGDLTLAQPAGEILVGLTLRPGEPGDNDLLLYLVPLMGEDTAGPLEATIDVAGERIATQQCGTTCRRAAAELRGGEMLRVTLEGMPEGVLGGTATFTLPDLPAPDGQELLTRAQERMRELDSVAIDERLSAGRDATEVGYQLAAPDRLRIDIAGGGETRIIGETRYRRESEDGVWESEPGPVTETPRFTWDNFLPPVAPRVIGEEEVDGEPTTIVAFAGPPDVLPVWFRLWVGEEGLVHRAAMHAQGHFMHHRYHSFDQPMDITAPAGSTPRPSS